jgi:hypothetical protein
MRVLEEGAGKGKRGKEEKYMKCGSREVIRP